MRNIFTACFVVVFAATLVLNVAIDWFGCSFPPWLQVGRTSSYLENRTYQTFPELS